MKSTDQLFGAASHVPAQPSRPLFVLSVWRAGSSLLYALLNQHSQIALLYEADLPLLQPFFWGRSRGRAWLERWEFWNQSLSRHGIAAESLPAGLPDAWEAARVVYQSVARRKQAAIWGEKSPTSHDRAPFLAEKFPDARFIVLWRDPRAVIRSVMRSAAGGDSFFRKRGMIHRALLGCETLREGCDRLIAKGRSVHEVNYEDLISNTCECINQMCQFLEIPFEPQVAFLEGADRSAIFAGRHHAMVRSSQISSPRKESEILAPAMQAKIDRYICLWKKRYGGRWPKCPAGPVEVGLPGPAELWRDRITYRALRWFDVMTVVAYSLTPLAVLRLYRSRQGKVLQAANAQH
jgi:Sulfotransferase family